MSVRAPRFRLARPRHRYGTPSARGVLAGALVLAASAAVIGVATRAPAATPREATAAPQLHVSGNELVDQNGAQVVLHGMDRSGTEFACVQGKGIFDGPNDQTSIDAIKSWGAAVNAVRVPLNEACWNAESYVNPAYAGTTYINAIKAYVSLLNANGLVAILDLHWTDGAYTGPSSGCSSAQATCQKPMPDAAQAIPFWTSVASTFKGNDAVVFDLFNEPYASRATGGTTSGWQCWENGGSCAGISYQVAGMQQMVNAVRSTGASNVLMLGGEEYANDLTGWLQYKPTDPDNDLVASWHSYNFNACSNQACWNSQIAPVIAAVPVVAGEIGENDCSGSYLDPLTTWLDTQHTSYLAWTWNDWTGGCSSGPVLITDYTGTPTAYGAAYKAHLESLGSGTPPPTTPPTTPPGTGGCQASYAVVNSWSGGFQAQVTVTNSGSAAITGWTVSWTFGGDQKITQIWNATDTQSGAAVTASNVSYDGALAPGASTSFGFLGSDTDNAAPTAVSCVGG
jgi:endoglucanase